MFYLISIIIFIVVTIGSIAMSVSIEKFINIPSFVIVIIPSFFFAMAASSKKALVLCVKLLFFNQGKNEKHEMNEASRFIKVFGDMCLIFGIFYTLVGIIQILITFDFSKGDTSIKLPIALAVCLLTAFYGMGLKAIFSIGDQAIRNMV